jgi:hypothetical protein
MNNPNPPTLAVQKLDRLDEVFQLTTRLFFLGIVALKVGALNTSGKMRSKREK